MALKNPLPKLLLSQASVKKLLPYKTEDGESILLAKDNEGSIYIFEATCNHADQPLVNGKWDPETGYLTCPFHRAVFSLKDEGEVIRGPACLPLILHEVIIPDCKPVPE